MGLMFYNGSLLFVGGAPAMSSACCCGGGCCPNTLVQPTMAGDPSATQLQIEITDITIGPASCCLTTGDIGTVADLSPSGPLFWACCDLLPACIAGVTLTCMDETLALQWGISGCPGAPANPLATDRWELVSVRCDPIEFIFTYTWTQFFPNPCEDSTMTVKITEKP